MRLASLILAVIVLGMVLCLTNPTEAEHKEAIYRYAEQAAADRGERLAGSPGRVVATVLARVATDVVDSWNLLGLRYDNYLLFSTVSLDDELVSIGVLRQVAVGHGLVDATGYEARLVR